MLAKIVNAPVSLILFLLSPTRPVWRSWKSSICKSRFVVDCWRLLVDYYKLVHELNLILITVNGEKKIITDMLWLLPYKLKIISMTHYLKIDVSFKACKPFKYCIYHWIIFNVSIPLALSIMDIYDMLFIRCKKHVLKLKILKGKKYFQMWVLLSKHFVKWTIWKKTIVIITS